MAGDKRQRITKPQRQRIQEEQPTTGDGFKGRQKPKLSETNLPGKRGGFIAPLIRRVMGGRHQGR